MMIESCSLESLFFTAHIDRLWRGYIAVNLLTNLPMKNHMGTSFYRPLGWSPSGRLRATLNHTKYTGFSPQVQFAIANKQFTFVILQRRRRNHTS